MLSTAEMHKQMSSIQPVLSYSSSARCHQSSETPPQPNRPGWTNSNTPWEGRRPEELTFEEREETIRRLQKELKAEKSCAACLYTGVATCTGLSLYFAKLATEESTLKSNRRFLWICSTGSLVAGAYRWYLG